MFLIESLFVTTVVYWISALIGDIIFHTNEEKILPIELKISFGFFISMIYFAAYWQIFSINYVWVASIVTLIIYIIGNKLNNLINNFFRISFKKYLKIYIAFIAGSIVFFSPLIISGNAGPFSEGGGDVSIYSDVAKLYVDKGLTEKGDSGQIDNLKINFLEIFRAHLDDLSPNQREIIRERRYPIEMLSPPVAENAANSIMISQYMGSLLYTPYGAYAFLSTKTNYNVYYGIQAFLYSLILIVFWSIFYRFGKSIAFMAISLILGSHGLISVFYNTYASQAYAISYAVILLAALPYIRINSISSIKTYFLGLISLGSVYTVFLVLVLPISLLSFSRSSVNSLDIRNVKKRYIDRFNFFFKILTAALFILAIGIVLIVDFEQTFSFISRLVSGRIQGGSAGEFFGQSIPLWDWKSISFIFGILSQQHYLPFAKEYGWLNNVIFFGIVTGICAILLSGYLMKRLYCEVNKKAVLIYLTIIVLLLFYAVATSSSLYTQAKGAQNTIIYFYFIFLLPLALCLKLKTVDKFDQLVLKILKILIIAFILSTIVPRIHFLYRLAKGQDRGSILERSFFKQAEKIRDLDSNSFVIFEPRKSSDLYISTQPFFYSKMLPTKYLVLGVVKERGAGRVNLLGNEIIQDSDLPHLWLLSAEKLQKTFFRDHYEWKASRLVDQKNPSIILFGHDVEKNFGNRSLNTYKTKSGMFSYLRNGSAMLFIPSFHEGNLEVTFESRIEGKHSEMLSEISQYKSNGYFGELVRLEKDGDLITLVSKITKVDHQRLINIARFKGEFWLNVRFNDTDL